MNKHKYSTVALIFFGGLMLVMATVGAVDTGIWTDEQLDGWITATNTSKYVCIGDVCTNGYQFSVSQNGSIAGSPICTQANGYCAGQNATGNGTAEYLAKWKNAAQIANSIMYQNSTTIVTEGNQIIRKGTSNAQVSTKADIAVFEDNTDNGITIATPNASTGYIVFSDSEHPAPAQIRYNHQIDHMYFYANSHIAMEITDNGEILTYPHDAAITPLNVRAATTQTANLQEWQNDAGTALTWIDENGMLTITPDDTNPTGLHLDSTGHSYLNVDSQSDREATYILSQDGTARFSLSVERNAFGNDFRLWDKDATTTNRWVVENGADAIFLPGSVTTSALILQGLPGQSGDLQEWQDSSSTVLASINKEGDLHAQNLTLQGQWLATSGTLGMNLENNSDDLILHTNVEGANFFSIQTDGAFLDLYANPNPSNGYKMFGVSETQGSDTDLFFYEGGTGHNRFWDSGSARFGGPEGYLCSELTGQVDCDTSATGADVVIQDDLWAGGDGYYNGSIYMNDPNTVNPSLYFGDGNNFYRSIYDSGSALFLNNLEGGGGIVIQNLAGSTNAFKLQDVGGTETAIHWDDNLDELHLMQNGGMVTIGKETAVQELTLYEGQIHMRSETGTIDPYITFDEGTANWSIGKDNTGGNCGFDSFVISKTNDLSDPRLCIDASGNVGWGINAENALHAYDATDNEVARFESGDSISFVLFEDPDGIGSFGTSAGNIFLSVGTGVGTEVFTGYSNGNVQISTTQDEMILTFDNDTTRLGLDDSSPDAKLDIQNTVSTDVGLIVQQTSGQSADLLRLQGSGGATISHFDNWGNLYIDGIGAGSGRTIYIDSDTANGNLIFQDGGTNKWIFQKQSGNQFQLWDSANSISRFYYGTDNIHTSPRDHLFRNSSNTAVATITHEGYMNPGECKTGLVAGDICYNSTANKHYGYDGTTLNALY